MVGRNALLLCMATWILPACSDTICSADLRTAVTVEVSSPEEELPFSSVTASHQREEPCDGRPPEVAGARVTYYCYEQGPGDRTYTVRVKNRTLTWTKEVAVPSDECGVTETKTVAFDLRASTAD